RLVRRAPSQRPAAAPPLSSTSFQPWVVACLEIHAILEQGRGRARKTRSLLDPQVLRAFDAEAFQIELRTFTLKRCVVPRALASCVCEGAGCDNTGGFRRSAHGTTMAPHLPIPVSSERCGDDCDATSDPGGISPIGD